MNFGNSTENFSGAIVKDLIDQDKVEDAKAYIKRFFIKISHPVCIYGWIANEKKIVQYSYDEFRTSQVTNYLSYYVQTIEGKKVVTTTFKLSKWFLEEDFEKARIGSNITKPLMYQDKAGLYINTFGGYKFETCPENPSQKQKEGVQKIWQHMYEVLCSSNKECFEYVKLWISHMINGRKMKTALYFKSQEGTGKGIFISFLYNKVLGRRITLVTSNPSCLTGSFNGELEGKILLILEELRCATASEWNVMSNRLKAYITEETIDITEKYKSSYNADNNLNIILVSNHDAVRTSKDDRRYLIVDVSNHRIGDTEYFDMLGQLTNDDSIAEWFYWDCKQYAEANPKFNEDQGLRNITTETKQDNIIDNLHSLYKYIKTNYVLKMNNFDVYLNDLVASYNLTHTKEQLSGVKVSSLLKEIGIFGKPSTGNRFRYKILHEDLVKLFRDKKWIHQTDAFESDQDIVEDPKDYGIKSMSEMENEKLKSENELLRKEILELRSLINMPTKNVIIQPISKIETETKSKPIKTKQIQISMPVIKNEKPNIQRKVIDENDEHSILSLL
jgi:Family of unknown function (DUF5906)